MIRHYFRKTFILSLVFGMSIFLLPYGVFAQTPTSVYVDIKPGSCPNPMNVKSQGVLMVAILGTVDLDVATIDPASIKMVLPGGTEVAPIRSSIADVATYVETPTISDCGGACYTQTGDGYDDLTVKFRTQDIVAALELELEEGEELTDGTCIMLTLTGVLDGETTAITGTDYVTLLVKGNQYNYRHRHRNLPEE